MVAVPLHHLRLSLFGDLLVGWVLVVATVVWLLLRWEGGLYPPYGIAPAEEVRAEVRTTFLAAATHFALLMAVRHDVSLRQLFMLQTWVGVVPLTWALRSGVKLALVRTRRWGRPILVIGGGEKARRALREMQGNREFGYVPVGVYADGVAPGEELEGVPVVGSVADAARLGWAAPVKHVMIALSRAEMQAPALVDLIGTLSRRFPTVQLFPDLSGLANLWVYPRALGAYLALETRHHRFKRSQRLLKRTFDLAVGIPVAVLALPIIAVAAIGVKIVSPGAPVFFSQRRDGRRGREIRIWKIRSMVPNAEQRLAEYLAANPAARFEYERVLKLRKDPRILPGIGRLMRRSSIDELPQLWGVVTGDLSLVGPRVFLTKEVEMYAPEARALRREVPPGLTGLWQVNYRSTSDLHVREVADSYYVQNWSVWLDIWILLRTVRVVLLGKGAY
jgi:Undecaprenyl-phosphate galactose phosphotransferase WbaP